MKLYSMKHTVLTAVAAGALAFTLAAPVAADGCTTQYGGNQYGSDCPPQDLIVNKDVKHPVTRTYVENLGTADVLFAPTNEVIYRLTVRNTGDTTLGEVKVTDVLPPYLSYVSGGPSGTTYNPDDRTVTFMLKDLKADESRTFELKAKIVEASAFPSGRSVFCVVNTARVESGERRDEDTSQICIEANVLGTTSLPEAGFRDILMIVPFAALGFFGFTLLQGKKAKARK